MTKQKALVNVNYEDEEDIPTEKIHFKGVALKPEWKFSFGFSENEEGESCTLILWIEAKDLEVDRMYPFEFDVCLSDSDIPRNYVLPVPVVLGYDIYRVTAIINTITAILERLEVVLSDNKREVYITAYTPRKNFDIVLPWEKAQEFFDLA